MAQHDRAVVVLDSCMLRAVDPDRVAMVRDALLPADAVARIADLFRLLGDTTRARILYALLEGGELCVCDLAAAVEAAESTVSHALRLLRSEKAVGRGRVERLAVDRGAPGTQCHRPVR